MTTSAKKTALLTILRQMHTQLGFVKQVRGTSDGKLLVILENSAFTNVSVQQAIYRILNYLVEIRVLNLVGCDGACGEVDTGWLRNVRDQNLRTQMTDSLFKDGKLTGVEYCHIYSTTPFVLFGVDDKDLWDLSCMSSANLAHEGVFF